MEIYYYTLSTVAQTLAALLGLAAVFVALRLHSIAKDLRDYCLRGLEILKIAVRHSEGAYTYPTIADRTGQKCKEELELLLGKTELIERASAAIQENADYVEPNRQARTPEEFIKDTTQNLEYLIAHRDGLLAMIKAPGMLTSVTIIWALIVLSISDWLPFIEFFDGAIVAYGALCVLLTLRASWKILEAFRQVV